MNVLEFISILFSAIFFIFVLSYYLLIFIKKRAASLPVEGSLTVVIPAHNEEKYIAECISAVLACRFPGKKEIIVVDDGSTDSTFKIASVFRPKIKLIRTKHSGKSASLNIAIARARGDYIAVVDGDSVVDKSSLYELAKELSGGASAATGVVKVKNRSGFGMWFHIEQLHNSLTRSLFSRINANITTPGPLSMYKRSALLEIGGFSSHGFSEDADITIRLIRRGHKVAFCDSAVSETYMPATVRGAVLQRARFARGTVSLLKRHLAFNKAVIDLYTLPLLLFMYLQAIVMGSINIYLILSGYFANFASKGVYFSFGVVMFFFEWFSLFGFFKWVVSIVSGASPLSFLSAVIIITSLLSYPLYVYAIIKYDRKIDLWHVIPLLFMFPFWLCVMMVYLVCSPEILRKDQFNRWEKNA